ncbi:hypothetical protein [Sulfurisphaera ohwakuensis]|uniref:Uncharacterized protein n=1 Tax=Sulfurisphaera ohwakuensis TaxID=69656 RepID=A0A7J9RW59_SULOH|nr:hypothetical protein [Sulfurisphaera ohwakuensis]MBB5255248.1 hypothetical protein [Sulfurisphaera ohwakuensis]
MLDFQGKVFIPEALWLERKLVQQPPNDMRHHSYILILYTNASIKGVSG